MKSARDLAEKFGSIEGLRNATRDELLSIDDVGEIVADSILGFFADEANIRLIDALLAAAQKALENNSVIKLAKVSADMRIVLDITRVYRVFEIYATVEEAVASCREEKL